MLKQRSWQESDCGGPSKSWKNHGIVFRQGSTMIQFVLWTDHSGGFVERKVAVWKGGNQLRVNSRKMKKQSIGCNDKLVREDDIEGRNLG